MPQAAVRRKKVCRRPEGEGWGAWRGVRCCKKVRWRGDGREMTMCVCVCEHLVPTCSVSSPDRHSAGHVPQALHHLRQVVAVAAACAHGARVEEILRLGGGQAGRGLRRYCVEAGDGKGVGEVLHGRAEGRMLETLQVLGGKTGEGG